MALILLLNKAQYFQGQVSVYLGDDWELVAKVVDRIGSVDQDVDLTGVAASACFPSASGTYTRAVSVDACGHITMDVPATVTRNLQENINGIQLYCLLGDYPETGKVTTVQIPDPDLAILSRGFEQT